MHKLEVRLPRPELRPYIRTFVQRSIGLTSLVRVEPTTAQLEPILAFDFGTPVEISWHPNEQRQLLSLVSLGGPQTRFACHLRLRAGVESFGIFFAPTGFSRLFGIPVCELVNCTHGASELIGQASQTLWNRLAEALSFDDRVLIAENFLSDLAARAKVGSVISAIADYAFLNHGAVRVTDLASKASKGLRQFEREFQRELGMSAKHFARIARFQTALDSKVATPNRTWLDIAHSFGYHDQMHMIHDFEALGRDSPARLVSQLGDSRPPALSSTGDKASATIAYI